jgi:hypothetical protein
MEHAARGATGPAFQIISRRSLQLDETFEMEKK